MPVGGNGTRGSLVDAARRSSVRLSGPRHRSRRAIPVTCAPASPSGSTGAPVITVGASRVYRDVNLPSGTALAGAWSDCDIYIGSGFRIDVSSEAGTRFDQSVTGFRAEEEFGFNAEPYVRTGKFVKILGL